MSANLLVPFDNRPSSVAVKTASYTIPAGKYARVVVNLEGSATFTIGGVTALRGTQNSVLASDNIKLSVVASSLGALGTHLTGAAADLGAAGGAFNETTDQKSVTETLWLPTGTIINGTGTWRAVVMEYNEIT